MRRMILFPCVATAVVWLVLHWVVSPASAELLLFYDFNSVDDPNTVVDLSGKGNNADVIDAEFTSAGGGRTGAPSDYAIDFLSAFDPVFIDIPSAADGAFDGVTDNDSVTISLWLFGSDEQPVDGTLFWFAGGDNRQLLAHVPWSDSIIYFDMAGCDSCLSIEEPDETKYMGQWNHYAFVKDGELAAIYQNGELLTEAVGMNAMDVIWTARFGTFADDTFPYSGLMDDIAVWDEALSEEAIASLAAGINPVGGGVLGDFDGDGVLAAGDIDELTRQAAAQSHPAAFDLTNDARVDIQDVHHWTKTLFGSWIGDANLDNEFNSSDLVSVLSSGTYEADVDAVWSTGDFNGDGRSNSGDLVAALADGGYEAGPRMAALAVPEPSWCAAWIVIGLGLLDRHRRRLWP
jgi:hypothetical protein